MKLNKNGIPILDPPKEANKLAKHKFCLPDEHKWVEHNPPEGRLGHTHYKCLNCEDRYSEVEYDEQNEPWM